MADYIWNNMAFNSEDEMLLAREIPAAYLDRWNDAGYVAEAILDSDWMKEHDREVAAKAWDEAITFMTRNRPNKDHDIVNPYKESE